MKSLFLLLFLALGLVTKGQESGISFSNDTLLSSAIRKAMTENKLIFVDCYATWCVPCKDMEKEVFSDSKVGKFFNKNFINVKFDMYKPEGIKIKTKYNVKAYPTFLFLNLKGEQVYYSIGFIEPKAFINIAQNALNTHLKIMTNFY